MDGARGEEGEDRGRGEEERLVAREAVVGGGAQALRQLGGRLHGSFGMDPEGRREGVWCGW